MNTKPYLYLGLDLGSVAISFAMIDDQDRLVARDYQFHQGKIRENLLRIFQQLPLVDIAQIGFNSRAKDFLLSGYELNTQIAVIEGVKYQTTDSRSIFDIGGETFGLLIYDEKGNYKKYIFNSSCAAGTGSFLDQQASRLGFKSSEELSVAAQAFTGEPPKIATRCAVFAKTDLIHSQQRGYSLNAICAGLCKGMAYNIADALTKGVTLSPPVIAVGGVSKNQKVIHYLAEIIGLPITTLANGHLCAAIGNALLVKLNHNNVPAILAMSRPADIIKQEMARKKYFHPPLCHRYEKRTATCSNQRIITDDVEIDLYELLTKESNYACYLGIDIGSTSTKAVVTDHNGNVLFGLYTRTQGQPVRALQKLFKCIAQIRESNHIQIGFLGVGTTGSGRKFIQKVILADVAIDEITAHARAAIFLNPSVDTIIEIGGQDAKFTVLKDGKVTFSVMNYVCAAGTGSFIEEQAKRLGVPLEDYEHRAQNVPAPLTSERCTVFMERDLNYLLSQGYSVNELLAASLHSVCENYLSKVAHLNKIGTTICFQGATAKNEALVLAFEQHLKKSIYVSKFCHLTGALGVCLLMKEQGYNKSQFRGLELYQQDIQVKEEVCDFCKNHCKINKIELPDGCFGWGYLCGRDETNGRPSMVNRSGFDLLNERRKVFSIFQPNEKTPEEIASEPGLLGKIAHVLKSVDDNFSLSALKQRAGFDLPRLRNFIFKLYSDSEPVMVDAQPCCFGIPATLFLFEQVPLWQYFFKSLGHQVIISRTQSDTIEKGKQILGAEFCTPIANLHGHIQQLGDKVDYIFLPNIFEDVLNNASYLYCYYSSYAAPIIKNLKALNLESRILSPTINFKNLINKRCHSVYNDFPEIFRKRHTLNDFQDTFHKAYTWYSARQKEWSILFQEEIKSLNEVTVVLFGRPYLILDPKINKNIPANFNKLGIKTLFMDMLPADDSYDLSIAKDYLAWNHWNFGARILLAAEKVAQSDKLFPVFVTAFKCSPDSFIITYFKEIMDTYKKPYLILQLDEHSSDVGYETRIEAAIATFRNHLTRQHRAKPAGKNIGTLKVPMTDRTVLIPNYDPISCKLICAAFERAGYRALLLEQSEETIQKSLHLNDGQCLPVSCIAQSVIHTVNRYHLNPAKTTLYVNAVARLSCNFPQYPVMIKKLLEQAGDTYHQVEVYASPFTMTDMGFEIVYNAYCSYLMGGLLRRIGCKLRPYEKTAGSIDLTLEWAVTHLSDAISRGEQKDRIFKTIVMEFLKIPIHTPARARPKVAIVGDLYVRDNDIFNQNLIHLLEDNGGEVITTPFNYVMRMLSVKINKSLQLNKQYLTSLGNKLLSNLLTLLEQRLYNIANQILKEPFPTFSESLLKFLNRYDITLNHEGETAENLLKIFHLVQHNPGIKLIVHINPIFCCPALVSESIFQKVEDDIGIPIVSITYDGTQTPKNDILIPYLHYLS